MLNPSGQSTDSKGGPLRTDFDHNIDASGNISGTGECGKFDNVNFFKNGGEII